MTLRVGPFFDCMGMNGRIYVELHMTLLHTKYTHVSFGSCGFREDFFMYMYFHYKPMADNEAPGAWPV